MKIILDVMGADLPASEFVKGAVAAKKEYGVDIALVGDEKEIVSALEKENVAVSDFTVIPTNDVITMEDSPISIRRLHKDSSMAVALRAVANGEGDAAVSAGNTGALFIGASGYVHCIPGVRRAALATVMPYKNPTLLLDCGANADITPDFFPQFAMLGSLYMEKVMKVENPRVALINNGTEEQKGNALYKEGHQLLKQTKDIHFIGNVEGKTLPYGVCDVAVCDGFTGNILLKSTEGVMKFVLEQFVGVFHSSFMCKLAGLIVRKKARVLKKRFSAKEYGGAPFLGLSKPVIKAHGNSDAKAVKNAIRQAIAYVNSGMIAEIEKKSEQTI